MVEGLIGPKSHEFGARPADTRRFLEAVSAKAIDEEGVLTLAWGPRMVFWSEVLSSKRPAHARTILTSAKAGTRFASSGQTRSS
jgi:hypothetical protein